TKIVTRSPCFTELRFQPWFRRTFGAVISTVQSPSGVSSPSVTPSILIEACGLIQRNWVISPSIFTTRSLSNAEVEWCAAAGAASARPRAASDSDVLPNVIRVSLFAVGGRGGAGPRGDGGRIQHFG